MKKFILILSLILFFGCKENSQEIPNNKNQTQNIELSQEEKEDPLDLYNSENINSVDLLEALDLLGLQIHKFKLGNFDKEKTLVIFLEEYKGGKLLKSDTIGKISNSSRPRFQNNLTNNNFIDQLKFFTKTTNENSEITLKTYRGQIGKENIRLDKNDNEQFYQWREYSDTEWISNENVPILIFASSWYDENINNYRFCGVAKLSKGEESTNELLNNSPHYVLISYKTLD